MDNQEILTTQLFGRELTWITDCLGLLQFFDGYGAPTHMRQDYDCSKWYTGQQGF